MLIELRFVPLRASRSASRKMASLSSLPNEILYHILRDLEFVDDLASLAQVSRYFRMFLSDDDALWRATLSKEVQFELQTCTPASSYRNLWQRHRPHWFLARQGLWYSDESPSELLFSFFEPSRCQIGACSMAACSKKPVQPYDPNDLAAFQGIISLNSSVAMSFVLDGYEGPSSVRERFWKIEGSRDSTMLAIFYVGHRFESQAMSIDISNRATSFGPSRLSQFGTSSFVQCGKRQTKWSALDLRYDAQKPWQGLWSRQPYYSRTTGWDEDAAIEDEMWLWMLQDDVLNPSCFSNLSEAEELSKSRGLGYDTHHEADESRLGRAELLRSANTHLFAGSLKMFNLNASPQFDLRTAIAVVPDLNETWLESYTNLGISGNYNIQGVTTVRAYVPCGPSLAHTENYPLDRTFKSFDLSLLDDKTMLFQQAENHRSSRIENGGVFYRVCEDDMTAFKNATRRPHCPPGFESP